MLHNVIGKLTPQHDVLAIVVGRAVTSDLLHVEVQVLYLVSLAVLGVGLDDFLRSV